MDQGEDPSVQGNQNLIEVIEQVQGKGGAIHLKGHGKIWLCLLERFNPYPLLKFYQGFFLGSKQVGLGLTVHTVSDLGLFVFSEQTQ